MEVLDWGELEAYGDPMIHVVLLTPFISVGGVIWLKARGRFSWCCKFIRDIYNVTLQMHQGYIYIYIMTHKFLSVINGMGFLFLSLRAWELLVTRWHLLLSKWSTTTNYCWILLQVLPFCLLPWFLFHVRSRLLSTSLDSSISSQGSFRLFLPPKPRSVWVFSHCNVNRTD